MGYSLAVFGVLSAISQAWLSRILLPKVGEWRAVLWGTFGQMLSFGLLAFVMNAAQLYSVVVFSAVFWIAGPALQSLISAGTPSNEQGELQGSLNGLTSLTSIVSPLIATGLFAKFSNPNQGLYFPGVSFFFAAAMCLVSFIVVFRKKIHLPILPT